MRFYQQAKHVLGMPLPNLRHRFDHSPVFAVCSSGVAQEAWRDKSARATTIPQVMMRQRNLSMAKL